MAQILQFQELTYFYQSGSQKVSILEEADCAFEPGKLYTIVGPSGSGKTTTLTLAGALESPKGGRVLFQGKDLKDIGYTNYRNRHVAIVFQAYNLLEYLNPLQNVLAAMEITKNEIPNKRQRAEELLLRMGLTKDQIHRRIQKLSGGDQQRHGPGERGVFGGGSHPGRLLHGPRGTGHPRHRGGHLRPDPGAAPHQRPLL